MADIKVTGSANADMRACIAHLRDALHNALAGRGQIDAAQLLNETGDVAAAYQCYVPDGGVIAGTNRTTSGAIGQP